MKRAIAFLLFGPALAAVTVMLVMAQVARPTYDLEKMVAVVVFFFSLPVAALAGCLDAYLARLRYSVARATHSSRGSGHFVSLGLHSVQLVLALAEFPGVLRDRRRSLRGVVLTACE
jgi:hypothetical protein